MRDQHNPDVVLCDIKLPDAIGVSLISEMKVGKPTTDLSCSPLMETFLMEYVVLKMARVEYLTKADDNDRIILYCIRHTLLFGNFAAANADAGGKHRPIAYVKQEKKHLQNGFNSNKHMKKFIILLLSFPSLFSFAQSDSSNSPLTISGYIEAYYGYDFNKPGDHARPPFIYSHNRHNEVNVNLGFIKAGYQTEKVRANLALAAGTYMNANLAAEPGVFKNIYEANAGVKISKKSNLWIDAGIFASHIGFESAIGKDCQTLTRSILAENSPYYEAGAKISFTSPNEEWFISGLLLNGWQHIQRPSGNNTPAFGHQLTYKPNARVTLNSSSFIGNDKPDSSKQMRYFHNFYGIFWLNEKLSFTAGFDIGAEQKNQGSKDYNNWYSPVFILGFQPHEKHHLAARVEYYSDQNGVIIATGTPDGFKTWGYSLNYDYAVLKNVVWRTEAKLFNATDNIFTKEGGMVNNNFCMTTSLAISF